MTSKPGTIHNNLSMEERKALTKLRKRSDIVLKPADKGSGTVIMDYSWYVDEYHRQLNDTKYYQKQSSDLTSKIHERVKEYTTRLHKNDLIDHETFKYLSSNSDPKTGRFYILPKIHKQGNPGRPIISSNSYTTKRISEFVDYHLTPLVQTPQPAPDVPPGGWSTHLVHSTPLVVYTLGTLNPLHIPAFSGVAEHEDSCGFCVLFFIIYLCVMFY